MLRNNALTDAISEKNINYDADGNMTFDGRTGMSLTWNDLGLVKKVSLGDEDLVNYSYLADRRRSVRWTVMETVFCTWVL